MRFLGKKVVITGGANGIGKELVKSFMNQGAEVAVIDLEESAPMEKCDYFRGDLAVQEVLEEFANLVIAKYGQIDALINNAGITRNGLVSDCSYEEFLYVQKVGVVAPYYLTQLFKKSFSPEAAIVNIASTRWNMSQKDTESYTASKGGIVSLTHGLAASLSGKVRVNAVSPGWIDTAGEVFSESDLSQHPVKRVGTVQDIAQIVLFLCSRESSFVTGQNWVVDGGMSKLMIYHGDHGWTYEKDKA